MIWKTRQSIPFHTVSFCFSEFTTNMYQYKFYFIRFIILTNNITKSSSNWYDMQQFSKTRCYIRYRTVMQKTLDKIHVCKISIWTYVKKLKHISQIDEYIWIHVIAICHMKNRAKYCLQYNISAMFQWFQH